MQSIEQCPICALTHFTDYLICEDFTSSHESFKLTKCLSCSFVFTNPRPEETLLPNYYLSNRYISHTGKSSGLVDELYLIARKFTLQSKISLVKSLAGDNPSILDFGCGTGEFLHQCQGQNWQIAGLEPSPDARQKAMSTTGIKIASQLNEFSNQKFNVVTLWHVLEHVPELMSTVSYLRTLLNQNGVLLIAVPNHESPDAHYYKQYWAAYDVPRHLSHFTRSTMTKLLDANHLKIRKVTPMKLDAYYVSLLSEKYRASNRITILGLLRGVLRGFLSNLQARSTTNYSSLIYIITQ